MNDLAEKALHGAQVAARQVARRPVAPLVLLGFAAAAVVVVAGGRLGAAADVVALSGWLDLQASPNYRISNAIPGAAMVAGIVALLILWVLVLELARRNRISERQMWTVVGAWAMPFVVGPPQLSTDVYTYTAHGLLSRRGLDPYKYAPDVLHTSAVVNAIDPTWRGSPSTGGPLTTLIEHLAASITASHPLAMVIAFRVLGVVSAVAIGVFAAELAGTRRVAAIAFTTGNPAVLLYIVSGCHLTGPLIALVLASLVAATRGRWSYAVVLACLAAGVNPIALVAVPVIIAVHAIGQRNRISWQIAIRDGVLAVATLTIATLIVPDGLGWLRNINVITREHTLFAPANLVSDLISSVVHAASYDDLAVGGRIAALLAAVTVVSYLLVTVLERPLERTIGYALLGIGLLAPVLYPWYLLWGVLCLAPAATRSRRDWLIALSCFACLLNPPGFANPTSQYVTAGALAVLAALLIPRLRHWHHADAQRFAPQPTEP